MDGADCLCLHEEFDCWVEVRDACCSGTLLTLMDWTRLRSSSETGGSEERNETIAATIGGTFMADIVILCVFLLDLGSLLKKANQKGFC